MAVVSSGPKLLSTILDLRVACSFFSVPFLLVQRAANRYLEIIYKTDSSVNYS